MLYEQNTTLAFEIVFELFQAETPPVPKIKIIR